MVQHLLFANKSYDTSKQVVKENQIVARHGIGASVIRYVVYKIGKQGDSYFYHLINIETKEFSQTDLPRPLSEKCGIGVYYNDETPEFMDAFEVSILHSEAEKNADEKKKKGRQEKQIQTSSTAVSETVTSDFLIVDYTEKALAIFGDTKPIKDQLKALGGRFNPKLTYEGSKKAGWIFSKSKEQEIRNLLTIK